MTSSPSRSREAYLAFLSDRIEQTTDEAEKEVLRSCADNAAAYDRSLSPLATLARLVEACDAIASGEAAALAQSLGMETDRLRLGRTPLNSRTVDAYVRLRQADDQKNRRPSEWTGPRDATLRRPGDLRRYLEARRDALASKPRPSAGSRARRLEEIVGSLPSPETRQDMRFALEQGYTAQRELALLRKALETNFPGVNLANLSGQKGQPDERNAQWELSQEVRRALAQLLRKLQDESHLRHFGLTCDGHRLKLSHPPGTQFIEKPEFQALMSLLKQAATSPPSSDHS